jgi:HEAT repeat protein/PBS lyase HEAT-like repeat-containing protein
MARQQGRGRSVDGDLRATASALPIALSAVRRRQDEWEQALDKIEVKIDKRAATLKKLEAKYDRLDVRVGELDDKADKIKSKLDHLEAKYDKLEHKEDRKRTVAMDGEPVTARRGRRARRASTAAAQLMRLQSPTALRNLSRMLAKVRRPSPLRLSSPGRLGAMLHGGILAKKEAELDRPAMPGDKEEKELDQFEGLVNVIETGFKELEMMLDQLERELDETEADEDAKRELKKATGGFVGRRPARARRKDIAAKPRGSALPVGRARLARLVTNLRSGGPRARSAARTIERLGAPAVPTLLRRYDTPEEHLRWEIVNLLGYIKDPRAIPLLAARGIQDPEVHPRWRSIWALSAVDDGSVRHRLRAQLRRAGGLRRRNIAVALSLYGDRAAVPALRQALRARHDWDRWEAASCLAGYRHAGAAKDVLRLFDAEPDPGVRREMIRVVAGIGSTPVITFLRRRLRDDEPEIRASAADALAASANGQGLRLLRRELQRERHPKVRKQMRENLAALQLH